MGVFGQQRSTIDAMEGAWPRPRTVQRSAAASELGEPLELRQPLVQRLYEPLWRLSEPLWMHLWRVDLDLWACMGAVIDGAYAPRRWQRADASTSAVEHARIRREVARIRCEVSRPLHLCASHVVRCRRGGL